MRFCTLIIALLLVSVSALLAEGTRELAPNASIDINGNTTTDLAALHINNPSYNSFAAYTNPDPQSRLHINIQNPVEECLLLGFSFGHPNVSSPNPPAITYEFRIKDPNGNVVYGPVTVSPVDANIANWSEGFTGPEQLHGIGGYEAFEVTSADLVSQGWSGKGDYYIEFRNEGDTDFLIDFWDITVVDCSGASMAEKKGRVWSYNWAIFAVNDFGFPNRPFNGAFYVCAPDPDNADASFVTRIDFNGSGFRPAAFNVAFNSFGISNTGNVMNDRRSVENVNATQAEYSIFLNDPVEICVTAEVGEIDLIGVGRCDEQGYCIKFQASKAGQIDLLLDFDGDDQIYTPGTADVMVVRNVTQDEVGQPACIDWDGLDGLGQPVWTSAGATIPVIIAYAQGIYHFPIYDAELMTAGIRVQSVRPVADEPLLFYDDSNISVPSGSGEPSVQLSGCVAPCHRWLNYTMPNTPGFGNLHTINTWWFSQQIVRQDIFLQPAFLACDIEGPTELCSGGVATLTLNAITEPAEAETPEIVSYAWSGANILGPADGQEITIGLAGIYTAKMIWVNSVGDTCQAVCDYLVNPIPPDTSSIDTLILAGDTIDINGELYGEGGEYVQLLTTAEGCDSVLLISITVINTVILYDLDDCRSFMSDSTNMDYSEFVPQYPNPLTCAGIDASNLFRDPAVVYKHSCTPGVLDSPAMCVGSLNSCEYDPGNQASVVFHMTITPAADTAMAITGLSFFEQAPPMFDWISGPSGPNNYPTLFGFRVLKDGVEIYREEAVPTETSWHEINFDFTGLTDFATLEPAVYTFEFLPYCLVGNGAAESAWDMDHLRVFAACASPSILDPTISGLVADVAGASLPDVQIQLSLSPDFEEVNATWTDTDGRFAFPHVASGIDYYLRGTDRTGWLNGVNTLDLLAIQRHLLGIREFQSPYQYIAADANGSQTISAIDMIELRKLLLGMYTELPRSDSWRFGLAGGEPTLGDPWSFKDVLVLQGLEQDMAYANFIGVKIGDVTGAAQHLASMDYRSVHTMDGMTFPTYRPRMTQEGTWVMDVLAPSEAELYGLQGAMKAIGYQIRDILPGALPIEPGHYHTDAQGQLAISWSEALPVQVFGGDRLFTLVLTDNGSAVGPPAISFPIHRLANEVYIGESLTPHPWTLIQEAGEDQAHTPAHLQVVPNPIRGDATIRFVMETEGDAILSVVTPDGRLLSSRTSAFAAGAQVWSVPASAFGGHTGMAVVILEQPTSRAYAKVIVMR